MGPLGKIAPLLSKGVSGVFGLQMLKGAYHQYPDIRDAVKSGDWTKAAGAITTAVLSGGLGAMAGASCFSAARCWRGSITPRSSLCDSLGK